MTGARERGLPPLLLHVFSTFAPGGPQVRTVGLVRALGGAYRHVVLPMDGRAEAAELLPADAVRLLPRPRRASSPRTLLSLRGLLARERPAAVLTYNWGAIEAVVAARTLGLPVLHHEDGFLPDEARAFKRRRVWARRVVLRGARGVVVPSRRLEGIALRTWRLPRALVHWVPNGIRPVAPFAPAERAAARAALGIPPGVPVVGGVGHLRGEKNFARLVEAFRALTSSSAGLSSARLLILGDGPERARLEELARAPDLAGRVLLPGHWTDLRPAWAAMDLFAISSDTEQMPIALLEAMVHGLPVASTDVGDVRGMLPEPQRTAVVPLEGGAPALARALGALLVDPARGAELGALNRRSALEQFDHERMVEAYRSLYAATCSRGAPQRG